MANKMLIDATHPEETRVVVTRGNRVEEFDYESASRKQLRGNIYLAKVARIEPSLQAAFVNYGGNRHGFLAFAEIHPDYYQVPTAVREALLREEAIERKARYGDPVGEEQGNGAHAAGDIGGEQASYAGEEQVDAAPQAGELLSEGPTSEQSQDAGSAGEGHAALQAATGDTGEVSAELSGEAGAPAAEDDEAVSVMPLEAVLPAVVYEEFAAAVERAREAEDEIPTEADAYLDEGLDGDSTSEPASADADSGENKLEAAQGSDLETATAKDDAAGEGGVITVPETQAPTPVELVGTEDAMEEVPFRAKRRWRQYKIQEVIKRNQIVLVQVVKEERGTKGAALTTYLSLAGRYTVLMPNTASGGGISRKITVPADRKRLKEIAQELDVPEGMGLIIRTAGASRTKAEIKRDYEYLLRLWESVRDLTLKSSAPCLVYEEGNLIKRSIRDLYSKEIDEILVAGERAHHEAKEFMRMLMPSHAKNVVLYGEPEPLFIRYEVERQLNQMFSPIVTLRSGGYIVVNQTEALVAIDVNSGKATREYSIEDTALKTNLEAAEEVARQVRLRDLAGLIVIDFIDMDERRNNRAVERRMKECLRHDRARIQVGHISHFGLLEMSRQRLRQGVVEVSTMPCPTCQGVGHIRSTESVALMILRSIEDHLRTQGAASITATASSEAALYILNHKRAYLRDIEVRYGISIVLLADEKARGAHFSLERAAVAETAGNGYSEPRAQHITAAHHHVELAEDEESASETASGGDEKRSSRRKRRRRRGRGGDGGDTYLPQGALQNDASEPREDGWQGEPGADADESAPTLEGGAEGANTSFTPAGGEDAAPEEDADGRFRRNRRRGRRGGRRQQRLGEANGEPVEGAGFGPHMEAPGLGEQPHVNLDGMLHRYPSFNEERASNGIEPVNIEATSGEPVTVAADQVSYLETPALSTPRVLAEGEAQTQGLEPAEKAVSGQLAAVTPEPAPKPKPVRKGPARKGWWQRRIG